MVKEIKKIGSARKGAGRDCCRPSSAKRVSDGKRTCKSKSGGGSLNPGPGKKK